MICRIPILFFIWLLTARDAGGQTKSAYEKLVDSAVHAGHSDILISYFQKELKIKPDNEDVLRWLGTLYLEAGKPEACEQYYRKALKINPACARCYLKIAAARTLKKDYSKAEALVDSAIRLDEKSAEPYFIRAQLMQAAGKQSDAFLDYNKAIELAPDNADYYVRRGRLNADAGIVSLAIADFTRAIALAPASYLPYLERAGAHFQSRNLAAAMADASTAFGLDSTVANVYIGRAAIFAAQQQHDKALADYAKAISLNPKDFTPYFYTAGERYAQEDMDGYCSALLQAYDVLKRNDPGNSLKGTIEYEMGVLCSPAKASYYYQRGVAFYNRGEYQKAVSIYTEGLKKFPGNSMSLSFRGNALLASKAYEAALKDYEASNSNKANLTQDVLANAQHTGLDAKGIATYTEGFLASNYLSIAECLTALNRHEEALQAANTGIQAAPKGKGFPGLENWYNVRGNIYLALRKYSDAKADFDKCIELNKAYFLAYVGRAIVRMAGIAEIKQRVVTISSGAGNMPFTGGWSFQVKASLTKQEAAISAAFTDCDKAIDGEPKLEYAWYIRSSIKQIAGRNDYCYDLLKAKALGYPVEDAEMAGCK